MYYTVDISKLDISASFWFIGCLLFEYSNPHNCTTIFEYGLQLLHSGSIIYILNKYRFSVFLLSTCIDWVLTGSWWLSFHNVIILLLDCLHQYFNYNSKWLKIWIPYNPTLSSGTTASPSAKYKLNLIVNNNKLGVIAHLQQLASTAKYVYLISKIYKFKEKAWYRHAYVQVASSMSMNSAWCSG